MTKTAKPHRTRKIVLIVLAVLLVLILAAVAFAGNYLFHFALNPQMEGGFLDNEPMEPDDGDLWFLNQSEERWLTSHDGLSLHSWYLSNPAGGHKYAVVCHGYGAQPIAMTGYAQRFYDMGFHILVPAARAHEQSEGRYAGMGWPERRDIVDWVNTLVEQDPEAEIVLFGISMGGATVMMTAGEADLSDHVKCVVEDCGYSSVWDEFAVQLRDLFGLPTFPLLDAASLVCQAQVGYGFREASAVEQLKKTHLPMLFIHGEEDTFVPYAMLDVVYNACASAEKERLSIPGAKHGGASGADPELYWSTVETFLEKYIDF